MSARIAELRALGRYRTPGKPAGGSIYAEAAAQARLEPFQEVADAARGPARWARLRAVFGRREPRGAEGGAGWTVAASPIVAKGALAGRDVEQGPEGLLAGLPLRAPTQQP